MKDLTMLATNFKVFFLHILCRRLLGDGSFDFLQFSRVEVLLYRLSIFFKFTSGRKLSSLNEFKKEILSATILKNNWR